MKIVFVLLQKNGEIDELHSWLVPENGSIPAAAIQKFMDIATEYGADEDSIDDEDYVYIGGNFSVILGTSHPENI